jgi:DNA-directed RNA polymerase I subunit RPA1
MVILRNGELLAGVLDKNQCGSTANGLIHACFEVYGGRVASEVLSAFGRLFTAYLKFNSISLGVDDILLTDAADAA